MDRLQQMVLDPAFLPVLQEDASLIAREIQKLSARAAEVTLKEVALHPDLRAKVTVRIPEMVIIRDVDLHPKGARARYRSLQGIQDGPIPHIDLDGKKLR